MIYPCIIQVFQGNSEFPEGEESEGCDAAVSGFNYLKPLNKNI